jgi:hypothetical protein
LLNLLENLVHGRDIETGVVRFDMRSCDLAILDNQGISFRAISTEDGSSIEVEVESIGECKTWVGNESNLMGSIEVLLDEVSTYSARSFGVELLAPGIGSVQQLAGACIGIVVHTRKHR